MKLLEIAKKNALNVHGGLNKNESISMRAGGEIILKFAFNKPRNRHLISLFDIYQNFFKV